MIFLSLQFFACIFSIRKQVLITKHPTGPCTIWRSLTSLSVTVYAHLTNYEHREHSIYPQLPIPHWNCCSCLPVKPCDDVSQTASQSNIFEKQIIMQIINNFNDDRSWVNINNVDEHWKTKLNKYLQLKFEVSRRSGDIELTIIVALMMLLISPAWLPCE